MTNNLVERLRTEAAIAREIAGRAGIDSLAQSWLSRADTYEEAIEALSTTPAPMPRCVACEDSPAACNNPCAVCGASTTPGREEIAEAVEAEFHRQCEIGAGFCVWDHETGLLDVQMDMDFNALIGRILSLLRKEGV